MANAANHGIPTYAACACPQSPSFPGISILSATAAFLILLSGVVRAGICVVDAWDNGSVKPQFIYPNWSRVWAGSYDVLLCDGCGTSPENIIGVTVVNFGSAPPADIAGVYWKGRCGATLSPFYTMSYAGTYTEDTGSFPAWTWNGSSISFSGCPDLCGTPACGGYFTIDLYIDVASCPTRDATVQMGFSTNAANNPAWWGSIRDGAGCAVPWYDMFSAKHTFVYVQKSGPEYAAPGDTVEYTIYYGKPGNNPLSEIVVMDTQPPYTHYLYGSGSPAPDAFWDPYPSTPPKLKWTIPGMIPVAGGPTSMVRFSLTVDWGNGDSFEAGSGNTAAPEGERLNNQAQVFFNGITGCGMASAINPPITTVVRRFLFFMVGDNDVLFAPALGQPPDEITYEMFIRNTSDAKTWWNVSVWDTVSPELDTWCNDCGIEDPCAGWTMTPTGCASASAGRVLSGASTMLTWRMDMPPQMTISLRWKAQIRQTASPGQTAVNQIRILQWGRTGIVDGTGHSGVPRGFAHLAPVILPTSYISYVAHAAGASGEGPGGCCPGFLIDFFPLNKKAQFELRALQYQGAGWSTTGGVSASIGTLIGTCLGGFPGGGGISGGGIPGCRAERIPAKYDPTGWQGVLPTLPAHFIYKLVANVPMAWQLLTHPNRADQDNMTYAPSSTMTYTGMIHYLWRRYQFDNGAGPGDELGIISTGADPYGTYNPALKTSVHLFSFDYGTNTWTYRRTYDLGGESVAYDVDMLSTDECPWRILSSDTRLIVAHGFHLSEENGCCCSNCANDNASLMPSRETGNVVSGIGAGTHYGLVQSVTGGNADPETRAVVGNVGGADARYEIWRYVPDNPTATGRVPARLNATSGKWVLVTIDSVPAGLNSAGNPHRYNAQGAGFDSGGLAAFKVRVLSGGPIQVLGGIHVLSPFSGGSVLHSSGGNQTGSEFWLHDVQNIAGAQCGSGAGFTSTQTIDIFCSKSGMVVRAVSSDGYTATYTTTGPDQCVSFTAITNPATGTRRNYRFNVLTGERATAQFIQCRITEKGYTAPFLQTGVHYLITAPPVVFLGQSFWITIVVLDSGGLTKDDYLGTTSFTSTDPGAKIQATAMEMYNYAWVAEDAGVKVFVNVSFLQIGIQTIVATDTMDGSINGLTAVMVVAADIKLEKRKKLSVAASGDTVQFQLCWSNYSSATGFSFTITDAVPMGTSYVPEVASTMLCGASAPVPGITVWYSTATTTTPPGTFTSVPGTGSPLGNTRWLRWTIRDAYVNSTGCVCFRVSVN